MKKRTFLFMLAALLMAVAGARAQETLTVYEDGTETNEYVPLYGWFADQTQRDQMIFPASELADMNGGTITQMVFYIAQVSGSDNIGDWIVSLGETTATTLSGLDNATSLTEVYSGEMTFNSDETLMTVTFTNSYTYNGGNLLVEFNHPVKADYKRYYFLGVNATGASYSYGIQCNFLPKTTFSYQNPACPKPKDVTATDPTAHGATVSWTGSSDSYILMLGQPISLGSYDFESNSIPAAFTNSIDYPWTVVANTHSGGYCAKSGNAGIDDSSSDLVLEVNLTSAGSVSFSALVSSEDNYDWGYFLINGTEKFKISDSSNSWTDYSYDLAAGSHTLTWKFDKDSGSDDGDDCFYVDDIKIDQNPTTWDETHTANASTYTFTDLDPETSYLVMVKGVCDGEPTEPSAVVRFTTLESCATPQNLTVTSDGATATATWTGTEGTCNIDINGTVTNNVTSPYTFNVELSTTYTVKVQANCDGGETSDWSDAFSFTTPDCLGAHTIEYTLTDSWGDGWNGNAIVIKDACDVLETLTIARGYTNSGTLTLCGNYYQLTWQKGDSSDETSFTLTVDGTAIYTDQSGKNLTTGQVLYTIGTAPTMLPKPTALAAGTPESNSVELSWTENGEATDWELCVNGDESTLVAANSNPFTLTGLTPDTDYTVKVRSTDGTNESCWSDAITFHTAITLSETADNASWITENNGVEWNVTLGRTLRTGGWNTFTVPFATAIPEGWTVKKLKESSLSGTTLTLTFDDAENIEAGKPYLVQVGNANVENPTFESVTIANGTTAATTTYANFVPVMNPTELTPGDESVLFITGGNTLSYLTSGSEDNILNGFRAYFQLHDLKGARAFVMSFGNEETGIVTVEDSSQTADKSVYSIDGRRIDGQPTRKGVYIVNGKKTIIK